jgi:hypothetical protein
MVGWWDTHHCMTAGLAADTAGQQAGRMLVKEHFLDNILERPFGLSITTRIWNSKTQKTKHKSRDPM